MASAVSTTRQTTTAAISIGLPSRSFTFSRALSKFRTRIDTRRFVKNGLANRNPGWRAVPTYLPNSCRTLASFGFTTKRPAASTICTASATSAEMIHPVCSPRMPLISNQMEPATPARSRQTTAHPDTAANSFSRIIAFQLLDVRVISHGYLTGQYRVGGSSRLAPGDELGKSADAAGAREYAHPDIALKHADGGVFHFHEKYFPAGCDTDARA